MFSPTDWNTFLSHEYSRPLWASRVLADWIPSSSRCSGLTLASYFIITWLCCRHCNSYGRTQIFGGISEVSRLGGRHRPRNRRRAQKEHTERFNIFWRTSEVTRKGRTWKNVQSARIKKRRSHTKISTVLVQCLWENWRLAIHPHRDHIGRMLPCRQKHQNQRLQAARLLQSQHWHCA